MELNELRERINDIDDQMVRLFVERMQVAAEIAGTKAEKNLPLVRQLDCDSNADDDSNSEYKI